MREEFDVIYDGFRHGLITSEEFRYLIRNLVGLEVGNTEDNNQF